MRRPPPPGAPAEVRVLASAPIGFVQIAGGGEHTCALDARGHVYCWGRGDRGQLGNGGTADAHVPTRVEDLEALAVAAGAEHSCALTRAHAVVCWGANGSGQLGDGTRRNSLRPVVTKVTGAVEVGAGGHVSCMRRASGDVVCVGDGSLTGVGWQPAGPSSAGGVALMQAGPDLGHLAPVAGLDDAAALTVGESGACARRVGGGVVCWGWGSISAALGAGRDDDGVAPLAVPGLPDARAVAAGSDHYCALRTTGAVTCWGARLAFTSLAAPLARPFGKHGQARAASRPVTVPIAGGAVALALGRTSSCALLGDGGVTCWGDTGDESAARPPTPRSTAPRTIAGVAGATHISAGRDHACALLRDGEVVCWGDNTHGQLGDGTTTTRAAAAPIRRPAAADPSAGA